MYSVNDCEMWICGEKRNESGGVTFCVSWQGNLKVWNNYSQEGRLSTQTKWLVPYAFVPANDTDTPYRQRSKLNGSNAKTVESHTHYTNTKSWFVPVTAVHPQSEQASVVLQIGLAQQVPTMPPCQCWAASSLIQATLLVVPDLRKILMVSWYLVILELSRLRMAKQWFKILD